MSMPRSFQRAVFQALKFEAGQIAKVEVNIGSRSQTVTMKFALTPDQVKQLDAIELELEAEDVAQDPAPTTDPEG